VQPAFMKAYNYPGTHQGMLSRLTPELQARAEFTKEQLDRLAVEAVRACKVTPGTLDGKPERLTSRVTYVWQVE